MDDPRTHDPEIETEHEQVEDLEVDGAEAEAVTGGSFNQPEDPKGFVMNHNEILL
jgi:hypothetical protein